MATSNMDRLETILNGLGPGMESMPISVRELISWFGAERRGYMVAYKIRKALEALGVTTKPDFDSVPLDSKITLYAPTQEEITQSDTLENVDDPANTVGTQLNASECESLPQKQLISELYQSPHLE